MGTELTTQVATDAVQDAKSLRLYAACMYDLLLPLNNAATFVAKYRRRRIPRLSEYNLRLSLKWQLLPVCKKRAPSPRPQPNPIRVDYPFDNYARSTRVTMASLLCGQMSAGPWQEVALRYYEDLGGHIGETQMILALQNR